MIKNLDRVKTKTFSLIKIKQAITEIITKMWNVGFPIYIYFIKLKYSNNYNKNFKMAKTQQKTAKTLNLNQNKLLKYNKNTNKNI